MARAQDLAGDGPLSDLKELPDALARAIAAVDAGRPYVLDVVVRPGSEGEILTPAAPRR